MKKEIAEFIGTFTLVLFGCGAAVIAGGSVGVLGIAFAFGLALIAAAYTIGHISGCHINPAVTIGAIVSGRMDMPSGIKYMIAQSLGAIAAAFVLMTIAEGQTGGYDVVASGLGQNGWGDFNQHSAFVFEAVATFLFVLLILSVTAEKAMTATAGLAIGAALVVIHIVGIDITGTSVNPARSLGPAVFVGGEAMDQLWLFIAAPAVGAIAAGLVVKNQLIHGK